MRRAALFMPRLLLLVAAALLALSATALARTHAAEAPRAHAAIIGGSDAQPGSWPSAAYVQAITGSDANGDPTGFSCTGTVVAPNVVLTAGHCAFLETADHQISDTLVPAEDYTIATGTIDPFDDLVGRQLSGVSQVIPYPSFDHTTLTNDAAVLILSTPTTAAAIPLATTSAADRVLASPPTTGQIAGWGLEDGTNPDASLPNTLQQATTTVQSNATCFGAYGSDYVAASMLCTLDGARVTGTCNGDSGGPLLAQRGDGTWVEIGLTSWGVRGCSTDMPSVFTRISSVSSWVGQQIVAASGSAQPAAVPTTTTSTTTTFTTTTSTPTTSTPTTTSPTPPAAVTPLPPLTVAPAAGADTPRAGRYRGSSRGGRTIVLRVATGGRAVSGLRFAYAMRCTRRTRGAVVTAITPNHRWPIVFSGAAWRFERRFRGAGTTSFRVVGRLTRSGSVSGTLRVTAPVTRRYGRCDSGVVRYSASLR
jgi:secreted trypsin-like serine protease